MERTDSSPGTLFTASSMGRDTVTIIWSMGMTPLSTAIRTRGKSVVGKTDTGMVKARYAPNRAKVTIRKMTGLECRAIQWSEFGEFTQLLRGGYFSLLSPLGAFDPSLVPSFDPSLDPSAGASVAASTLILVLSGSPYAPLVTTLSFSVTPSRIWTSSACRMPTFTAFWWARPSVPATITAELPSWAVITAVAGTTSASFTVLASSESCALVPGRNW